MKLEILNKSRYAEYDQFLLSCPHSLFYHSTKYKDFLEDLLNCESHYLLAYDDNKIVAALPLMIKDGPLGKVVNSLPYYGSNGGIVSHTGIDHSILMSKYNDLIAGKDFLSATYIVNPLDQNYPLPKYNSTDARIGQFTQLPSGENYEEELFKIISGNRRNEIRKAKKLGVSVSVENHELEFIKTIHQNEMIKNNRKFKENIFFSKLNSYFIENIDYKIFIARYKSESIAGLLMFYFNNIAEYFTPVVIEDARKYQPMSLILHYAMLDALQLGYKIMNWGGTWHSQEGVYRFKKQMGAQDYPYHYYTQINNKEILKHSPAEILAMYPNFYTFNFNNTKAKL